MSRGSISHFVAGAFCFIILANIYACYGALVDNFEKERLESFTSDALNDKKEKVLNSKQLSFHADVTCNVINKCKNGGVCNKVCQCPKGTSGNFCEGVDWCENDRCGITDEVECLYNETSTQGYCKCKETKHLYNDNTKTCQECDCGNDGECILVGNIKTCICKEGFSQDNFKCKLCDCGLGSLSCFFKRGGSKVCICKEKYALRTYGKIDSQCQLCDCGHHGKCHYNESGKVCECEENYIEFKGECRECFCGEKGSCNLDSQGEKICHCDYGSSPYRGICVPCHCDPWNIRGIGAECIFVNDTRQCICPKGFQTNEITCEDINECLNKSACPPNTNCVNVPGTFQCECKTGYQISKPYEDVKYVGCKDIDECSINDTCIDPLTECINTPGSYDCVCKTGYYSTAGNQGESYIPMYNICYPATDQWLAATIALGTIMFFGICTSCCYIIMKKEEGRPSPNLQGLRAVADVLDLIRICV